MDAEGARAGSRRLTCARCGAAFGCGVDDETCWCARVDARLPLPQDAADCLCPDCLQALARSVAHSADRPRD